MDKKNVVIVGASKGLGADLATFFANSGDWFVTGSARSSQKPDYLGKQSQYISLDLQKQESVLNFATRLKQDIKFKVDLLIYTASAWGESGSYKVKEFEQFLSIGPIGLLNTIEALSNVRILADDCNVIAIGSTATLKNNSYTISQSNPVYAASKLLQLEIMNQLQRMNHNNNQRFTTITAGGLGGPERLDSKDIFELICNLTSSISNNACPMEIILPSISDF